MIFAPVSQFHVYLHVLTMIRRPFSIALAASKRSQPVEVLVGTFFVIVKMSNFRQISFEARVYKVSVVTIQVSTSVEFLDLSVPGAQWVEWPSLATPRCCWPKVTRKYFNHP